MLDRPDLRWVLATAGAALALGLATAPPAEAAARKPRRVGSDRREPCRHFSHISPPSN